MTINDSDMNKIYEAIRKTYGYTKESDRLVDLVIDMANIADDED